MPTKKTATKKTVAKNPEKWSFKRAENQNPHKQGSGWDKNASAQIGQEFADHFARSYTKAEKEAVRKFLAGVSVYVKYAGWKSPIKRVAVQLGVIAASALGKDE